MLPAYAELHCRSNFSFLTGASQPEELVAAAQARGYAALAITDECSMSGAVRALVAAQGLGFRVLVGAEMQLAAPSALPPGQSPGASPVPASGLLALLPTTTAPVAPARQDAPAATGPRLVLLAQTRRGYGNLSQWISVARRQIGRAHV